MEGRQGGERAVEERVTTCVIRTNPDRQVVVSEVLGRAAVVVWLVGEGSDDGACGEGMSTPS